MATAAAAMAAMASVAATAIAAAAGGRVAGEAGTPAGGAASVGTAGGAGGADAAAGAAAVAVATAGGGVAMMIADRRLKKSARFPEGATAVVVAFEKTSAVHLAYSGVDVHGNPTGMTVAWTSAAGEAPPVVEYGLIADELDRTANGTSDSYLDTVHHRVSLEDLEPGTRFFYRCGHPHPSPSQEADASEDSPTVDVYVARGSGKGDGAGVDSSREMEEKDAAGYGTWSQVSSFEAAPGPERWAGDGPWDRPVSVAVVGDFGLVGAGATFDRLHQLVDDGEVDFIIHLGDIACKRDVMHMTSRGYASKVPYMVVPGNHEAECHSPQCLFSKRKLKALKRFGAYNARFRMPSLESGADHGTAMWYSFNVGPVHFVIVDTETDFPGALGDQIAWFRGAGNGGFGDQLAWLEEDLARAQQERDVRPWVIVAGHRPVYARESAGGDGRIIYGSSERVRRAFEPIFERYEVDVYLSGHVHTYERSFPVVDNTVRFASTGGNDGVGSDGGGGPVFEAASRMLYEEPAAPVHVVNGAGGNIEGMTRPQPMFPGTFPRWHAHAVNMLEGVGILSFTSMSEMRSMFVTSDSPAEVLDELIIRHRRL
eukprot:jgi/Undpi1/1545/HiC_scaffold_11.g04935.m1